MTSRQRSWPRQWLMTDERMGERLWEAIDRLPIKHSGVVFRHYQSPPEVRATLAGRVAEICRRRTLTLAIAGDAELARTLGADLVHNPPELPVDMPFQQVLPRALRADPPERAPAGSRRRQAPAPASAARRVRPRSGRAGTG